MPFWCPKQPHKTRPEIYKFSAVPIKIPTNFLAEIDTLILKFTQKFKGPKIAKTIFQKNKVEGLTLPISELQ